MAWPLGAEGLEGQSRCLPEVVAEILEVGRVVRNCGGPFRASEDNGVRAGGEDEWTMVAGGRMQAQQVRGAGGQEGLRIWGSQLRPFCGRDTLPGGSGPLAGLLWKRHGTEWCVARVLGRSWYGAGRTEGVKALSGSRRSGGEGVYCSHRKSPSVPLWPAIALTYN